MMAKEFEISIIRELNFFLGFQMKQLSMTIRSRKHATGHGIEFAIKICIVVVEAQCDQIQPQAVP